MLFVFNVKDQTLFNDNFFDFFAFQTSTLKNKTQDNKTGYDKLKSHNVKTTLVGDPVGRACWGQVSIP